MVPGAGAMPWYWGTGLMGSARHWRHGVNVTTPKVPTMATTAAPRVRKGSCSSCCWSDSWQMKSTGMHWAGHGNQNTFVTL